MATVAYNGVTLWDDGSLDIGQVSFLMGARERLIFERHPARADGNILKVLGRGSAPIVLGFTKRFSNQSGVLSYAATVDAFDLDTIATLAVTGYGSVSNCALIDARPVVPAGPLMVSGTTYQKQDWLFIFSKLR